MIKKILSVVILAVLLFNVSNSFALSKEEIEKLPHISATVAYQLFQQNKILIIDVNTRPGKKQASIVGAHYIPLETVKTKRIKFPKNKIIGVYCR